MSTERNIKIRIVTTDERAQLQSFLHECLHIWHRDHDSSEGVQTIEEERHKELEKLLAAMV